VERECSPPSAVEVLPAASKSGRDLRHGARPIEQGQRELEATVGEDVVTGARVEVSVDLDGSPTEIWELITDVTRIGEWSPECVEAWWLDEDVPPLRVGARFEGHNRYPGGFEANARCVVTQAEAPTSFAWAVLDSDELIERPGSTWSYTLTALEGTDRTTVTHRFVHGPGMTGVRQAADDNPDNAQQIVDSRLDLLRRNMTQTIEAIGRASID
jgi:uncharacterized protein YndB with AHSA1/START domain